MSKCTLVLNKKKLSSISKMKRKPSEILGYFIEIDIVKPDHE